LADGEPIALEGRYRDVGEEEVLFRCTLVPVRPISDDVAFIFGAYSHKLAAWRQKIGLSPWPLTGAPLRPSFGVQMTAEDGA